MDWSFVLFAIEEGAPGLLVIAATLPVLALAAEPNRKLLASSAGLMGLATFTLASLLAGAQPGQSPALAQAVPLVGSAAALVLLVPSVLALKWRWLGVVHLFTLPALGYLFFIGSLVLSGDAT
jgi:hypothetical protein